MTPALARALELHQPIATRLPEFPTEEERAALRSLNKVRASILDDDWPKKIAAFRSLFSLAKHDQPKPALLPVDREELHLRLQVEEFSEYLGVPKDQSRTFMRLVVEAAVACGAVDNPLDESVDAKLDLIYTLLGELCEQGFSPQQINLLMQEVHASNLTKTDEHGKPIYDEGGKVLKGPNYIKADIAGLIAEMGNV